MAGTASPASLRLLRPLDSGARGSGARAVSGGSAEFLESFGQPRCCPRRVEAARIGQDPDRDTADPLLLRPDDRLRPREGGAVRGDAEHGQEAWPPPGR